MWTCAMLKANARAALSGRYWRSFWVCFIVSLLSGGIGWNITYSASDLSEQIQSLSTSTLLLVLAAMWLYLIFSFLWNTFLTAPLSVGRCRYFMESRQSPSPVSTLFSVFRTPYLNVVKVQLLTSLKIAAGILLLVVPGIYWAYCYALVPYLLAENPYLTTRRAMELSKEIMYGEKFHYFLLELSFLGWLLLCLLSFGIGSFFLSPYMSATFAEFYAAMRAKAFAHGLTTNQELGGFIRHDNPTF